MLSQKPNLQRKGPIILNTFKRLDESGKKDKIETVRSYFECEFKLMLFKVSASISRRKTFTYSAPYIAYLSICSMKGILQFD